MCYTFNILSNLFPGNVMYTRNPSNLIAKIMITKHKNEQFQNPDGNSEDVENTFQPMISEL